MKPAQQTIPKPKLTLGHPDEATVELGILLISPYHRPTKYDEGSHFAHVARNLLKRGLLMADAEDPDIYRCTPEGTDLVLDWVKEHIRR